MPYNARDTRKAPGRGETFNPGKYSPSPGRGPYPWRMADKIRQRAEGNTGDGGDFWHPAPGDSHIDAFKFVDARNQRQDDLPELGGGRRYIADRVVDAVRGIGELWGWRKKRPKQSGAYVEPDSVLSVRFAGGSEYEYRTSDHNYLEDVYNRLVSSDHPGVIVWSHLIDAKIPYVKTVEGSKPPARS
jgi:hypothetical protein